MSYFSIDYLIAYAFLLITLVVGLRAGRGIKDIRAYALANKQFGTVALTLTYLATDIGGAAILDGGVALAYSAGIIYAIANSGLIINYMIMAFVIAPRMIRFKDCMTLGDVMKSMYGMHSGILVGIINFIIICCLTGMELVILGIICTSVLGINASWGIVLGGVLFSAYTAHGGIRSVTITDVLQFIVFIVGIPLIAYITVEAAGGMQHIWATVPKTNLLVVNHEKFSYYLPLFIIWSFLPLGISSPIVVQRMLMAQHPRQLRDQFLVVGVFLPLFRWILLFIGLAALVLFPHIAPNHAVAHLIHNLLPVGVKGIAIAALVSVNMSSLDSLLHTAGLTVVHDVIKPICDIKRIEINELRWVRWATVLVSGFVILIGLYAQDALQLSLIALAFQAPTLLCPLLAGILGLKVDKQDFYEAVLGTLLVFVVTKLYMPAHYSHFITPILIATNSLIFMGGHLIKNKGFVMRKRKQDDTYTIWRPMRSNIFSGLTWRSLLTSPQHIITYSQTQAQKYGAPYVLLGTFVAMIYTIPYFLWSFTALGHQSTMLTLRFIGATLCALLIVKDKWPQSLLPYLPTFWHLTLLFCLPFTSTVMFLITQGSVEWLINVAITIMFLIVLVDWMSFILLSILGITLGLIFYQLAIGPITLHLDFSTGYLLIYQGIFATLIGLLFARRKQQRFDKLVTEKQVLTVTDEENKGNLLVAFKEKVRLLNLLKRAGIDKLPHITQLTKTLRTQEQEGGTLTALIQELDDTLTPMTVALEKLENRAMDFLQLKVETIAVDKLLSGVQERLQLQGHHGGIRFLNHTQHQELSCDPGRIRQLLVNGIMALQRPNDEIQQPLLVGLEDTKLLYPIRSIGKDYVKQVPALCFMITNGAILPTPAERYTAQMNGSTLSIPETAQGLLWHTHQRIIKAHYGYSNLSDDTSKDIHLYVIPVRINEVRPKDMDKPGMELGATLVRADDTYPGAQEQEKEFLKAVRQRTNASVDLVTTAIEMIKWYHGTEKRASGEPFYLHPLAVARIVLDYNQDEATILGALLHDTVEDTPMLLENIETAFGKEVADIVDGVTHLESNKKTFYKVNLSTHENFLMLLEIEDQRVLYVKLADRTHNMRTIEAKSYESQRRAAEETLQFFVPLAKQLGLQKVAEELKARSRQVLNGD